MIQYIKNGNRSLESWGFKNRFDGVKKMTEKTNVLKIKVGEFYDESKKKNVPVFSEAWEKESKDGKTKYFEIRQPVFINEVEVKGDK